MSQTISFIEIRCKEKPSVLTEAWIHRTFTKLKYEYPVCHNQILLVNITLHYWNVHFLEPVKALNKWHHSQTVNHCLRIRKAADCRWSISIC